MGRLELINVTKTYLPPFDDFVSYLRDIWQSGIVTNHGPLLEKLEHQICDYLGARHVFLISSGTLALQIAIKALDLHAEVVTTPFSYVATTSSLVWENCRPVYADIEPDSLCIDPDLVDQACSVATTAILATHVYGNACAIERLEETARRRRIPLIFDAAHTFGASYRNRGLSTYGDVSILSFHATKLFHTGEGGALVTSSDPLAKRIASLRNFGHRGHEEFWGLGINGKMSELHAAMGLAVLPHIREVIADRRARAARYDKLLSGLGVRSIAWAPELSPNFAYYPVLFPDEATLLRARDGMNAADIYPRRYFYPSLNTLPYIETCSMPVAEDASRRVLCLPMGHDVDAPVQAIVAERIGSAFD